MIVTNIQVDSTIKYVSCKVELSKNSDFIMCGEIRNGQLNKDSVNCVYYQFAEWDQLTEKEQTEIIQFAFDYLKQLV